MPLPELQLIARIQKMQARRQPRRIRSLVRLGMGDDCAVLRASSRTDFLLTTDLSLEGVHFRREWHPPESVGHRCLARGLSDIAAMGGVPVAAFLSLAVPANLSQSWVDGFMHGFMKLAGRHEVTLAGGDTAASRHGIAADVIVVGQVQRGHAVLRSGAQPGDAIYVTGRLGASAITLRQLRAGKRVAAAARKHAAHFYPEPRLAVARWLQRRALAHAVIDISDGLSTDLTHICQTSRVGAVVGAGKLPLAEGFKLSPPRLRRLALEGGEDYELLFTASGCVPASIAGIAVTKIGSITVSKGIWLEEQNGRRKPLTVLGWEHFRAREGKH